MNFLHPLAFALLLILPVAVAFLVWRGQIYHRNIRQLGDAGSINQLLPERNYYRTLRSALWLLALAALIVAMARPVWGINMDVIEIEGISLVFALDVSNSMAAQDILPSRLDRAKLAIHEMLDELSGNELGLVLFAGSSFVYFPLTTDTFSANSFLNSVSTQSISAQGTNLEEAIMTSLDLLETQNPTARVVVLMTDGEDHEGNIETAINRANNLGVTIYTIGYGGYEGAPVPVMNNRGETLNYKADSNGQLILSHLDEERLNLIAEQTGGTYWRASASGVDITGLVQAVRNMETGFLDSRVEERGIERFGLFVLVALLALTLEMLLPTGRKRSEIS